MLIYAYYFAINQQICIFANMNEYADPNLYERSNNDIIVSLGVRFRDYRMALRLTQKDISEQSGVSVMTIVRFERGESASIRLDNFVALMRSIQKLEWIAEVIPSIQPSLYDIRVGKKGSSGRVRKCKNER